MMFKRTASGAALLVAARLICRALDFVALLVLARFLTPADFGVVAVAIVWASFDWKRRLEERWMTEHFGARYDAYRRRVRALVPFVY